MTAGTLHCPRYIAVNEVPVNELVNNALDADGIFSRNVFDCPVCKDDSPFKGVVWLITLVYLDLVFRIPEFEANPQIQAGGVAFKIDDFHSIFSVARLRPKRFISKTLC